MCIKINSLELTIKIDGSGAVRVDLLDHNVQLLVCQLIVELPKNLAQASGGNVSVALLVVKSESLPQFLLQSLVVLFDDEFGSQLNEFTKLQAARLISIHLLDQLFENLFIERLTHQSQDIGNRLRRDAAAFLMIKAVESLLQNRDLLRSEIFVLNKKCRKFVLVLKVLKIKISTKKLTKLTEDE